MSTVTTEQLQKDFVSVRSLIDRGETFPLEGNGVPLGTFLPVVPEQRLSKRILGTLQGKMSIPDTSTP